jgi:hypothetical protein
MSEIPFVNQLGDAIEVAIARPAGARRRLRIRGRRRYLAVALAALAVAGGGAAVAGLLHDPVEIGFGSVACFETTEPSGNIAVIGDPTREPAELCAASMPEAYGGLTASDLIACMWPNHGVVVVVRGNRGSCVARGLAPLPVSYTRARRRAARLQALAQRFERRFDCLAPRPFARRLTRELRVAGWSRWRAVVRGGEGSCGRVSPMSGSALLGSIGPVVDAQRRTIQVRAAFPLSLERLVYDAGSPGANLFESSWARCYTVEGLKRHVREQLADTGVPILFTVRSLADGAGIQSPGGDRYADGCAVFGGASIRGSDGRTEIAAELTQRDAPAP